MADDVPMCFGGVKWLDIKRISSLMVHLRCRSGLRSRLHPSAFAHSRHSTHRKAAGTETRWEHGGRSMDNILNGQPSCPRIATTHQKVPTLRSWQTLEHIIYLSRCCTDRATQKQPTAVTIATHKHISHDPIGKRSSFVFVHNDGEQNGLTPSSMTSPSFYNSTTITRGKYQHGFAMDSWLTCPGNVSFVISDLNDIEHLVS